VPHDDELNKESSNQSETGSLEQRIAALEKENTDLKTTVEKQNGRLPNVSRRQTLTGLLAGGALLGTAGSASAKSGKSDGGSLFAKTGHDHSGDDLGEGEPVSRIDVTNLNTDHFSVTGPVATSSEYGTIQAALDAAAGGLLLINDTKTEEGIAIGPEHSVTTIRCVGRHGIHQPANPTGGVAVIQSANADSTVEDVTFIDLRIFNPSLGDGDIDNEDTIADQKTRTNGVEWRAPVVSNPTTPFRFEFVRPHIDHVNGYGIALQGARDTYTVRDGNVTNVCYDGYYARTYGSEVTITYDGCFAADCGRHNFSMSGTAAGKRAYVSGVSMNAYTSGLDIEHGRNVTLDLTTIGAGRATPKTGGSSALHSGLYISDPSARVNGVFRSINPKGYSAYLKAAPDGLTISHTDDVGKSSALLPPIWLDKFEGGALTVDATGGGIAEGGNSTSGVVYLNQINNLTINGTIRNAWGSSLTIDSSAHNDIDIVSAQPQQSGKGSAHVYLRDRDSAPTHNDITVVADEDAGNAEYAVNAVADAADYNRYSGVVAGAFASSATTGVGANSDANALL
jgi:hypothetical protein